MVGFLQWLYPPRPPLGKGGSGLGRRDLVFELDDVGYRFDRQSAIAGMSLTIRSGDRVGVIGSSGAGKSTLIKLLNLSLLPTAGELRVGDRVTSSLNPQSRRQLQRQIGTVYQQFHLVDNLPVIHNVNAGNLGRWSLFKALVSLIYPLDRMGAMRALTQVGIPEKLYERTDRLSGGQQQRVAIARVLVQDPLVILADEPTASLDRELSREVMDLLCNLCAQQNRTLVMSLHDVDLARRYCDRLIGLRQGRVLFDCATGDVTEAMLAQLYDRAGDGRS
jgi:phosphonate transport system ATP-binding protein